MEHHGKTAYEAYYSFSQGKSLVTREQLPSWAQLSSTIQEAWNWTATMVRREQQHELGLSEKS